MSNAHPGAARYNRELDDYGALDGTGPECDYVTECDAASVYALVWPSSDGVPVYCCPFHVGLYRADHPERYCRFQDHPDLADPDRYARDDRFYQLDDAPTRIRGGEFRRLGVDHRGEAHYFGARNDGAQIVVLRIDTSLDRDEVEAYPRAKVELGDYLQRVEQRRGWLATDDEVLQAGREVADAE